MSRSRRKKRRGFKPKSTDCNLCFFEDTCNQKTAKVCNSFVPADNSLPKAKESENSTIIFAVLLIVGCAYLVWR